MSGMVEQALRLAEERLRPPLFPDDAIGSLRAAAAWLAPVARFGLECRLDPGPGSLDVSQLIDFRSGDGPRLEALARAHAGAADERARAIWLRIEEVAAACVSGALPANALWLEYDLDRGLGPSSVPSVFANLTAPGGAGWPIVASVVSRLGARGAEGGLEENLARCIEEAGRFGGRARGLCGVMLSRAAETRILLVGIPAGAVGDYLRRVGWEGDVEPVVRAAETLWRDSTDTGLALELAPSPQPRVGIEVRLDGGPDGASTQGRILDDLVASGLCTEPKRRALAEWAGEDTPASAAAEWPESLLVESLVRPADELGLFYRMVHHVKVAAGGPHPPAAKAYLGLMHSWWKTTLTGYAHVV
jgi:hypothetical protein